ncbi:MAG: HEAT repeat domain-containing protein [Alphaproteobacteria bacterium]|nr:HEAT repeat domain-containing protein [Alphaproteobacteria bacterium]
METLVRHIEHPRSKAEFRILIDELRTRDVSELFEAAEILHKHAEDHSSYVPYWDCVYELRKRESEEVFETAIQLCKSRRVRDRQLGSFVLGDDTRPKRRFNREALDQLHLMLKTETNPTVLHAILYGIGGAQDWDNMREIKRIVSLLDHESEKVRLGVIEVLLHRSDRTSIATLIHLSRDKSAHIRDWATFGLGFESSGDTPRIRKALVERLTDEDFDTRRGAISGLAERKEPRVRSALIDALNQIDATASSYEASLVFYAVEDFGDKSLIPLIDHKISAVNVNEKGYWLEYARVARDRLAGED